MPATATALSPEEFDEIDAILDDLRQRFDETPQWEFCEGFMAALIVCRRPIPQAEYLGVLLDSGDADTSEAADAAPALGAFKDATQQARFLELWQRRWTDIEQGLAVEVESLDDERAYHPEVMDVRGAVAALPEAERADMAGEDLPSFAQVWAVGFMYAVENWPDEWQPPRDKEARKWLDDALTRMVTLTEDDTDEPTLSVFDDEGVPLSASSASTPLPTRSGRFTTCANSGATSAPASRPCTKKRYPAATMSAFAAVARSTKSATALERNLKGFPISVVIRLGRHGGLGGQLWGEFLRGRFGLGGKGF